MAAAEKILDVRDLTVGFASEEGYARVVEGVSFQVGRGETIGLVGESGCGKSVTAMSIMRLLPSPPSRVECGRILFDETDLLQVSNSAMRRIRGNRIGMIFQEPMTSLNPTFSIGFQICEVLRLHRGHARARARQRAVELLDMVGVGSPRTRIEQYPHQLSGGLRQRVMIAMALACKPSLLIADEPTTALDVTIQAQILDLLLRLRQDLNMSILMITHDLGVVAEFCDRVAVMYAGKIVETAAAETLFAHPRHPYTAGLLNSIPRIGRKRALLPTIAGMVPNPNQRLKGCYFADRCDRPMDICFRKIPTASGTEHRFTCWNPHES